MFPVQKNILLAVAMTYNTHILPLTLGGYRLG